MKFLFNVFLFFFATSSIATAEQLNTIKAAGFASKSFAIYVEARYIGSSKNKNLKIKDAKVLILNSDDKLSRVMLSCTDNQPVLQSYQESSYGAKTEGTVIGLSCSPQGEFIFMIYKELFEKMQKEGPETCGNEGILQTKPIAFTASFGHQAFCMEDWSSVSNPTLRFEKEFEKNRTSK
jgi:hypothetical protein